MIDDDPTGESSTSGSTPSPENSQTGASQTSGGRPSLWECIRESLEFVVRQITKLVVFIAKWIGRNFRRLVDSGTKLIAASAAAFVAYLAATYQTRASVSTLVNQREQTESQLRASMLSDLIEPIIGKNAAVSQDVGPSKNVAVSQGTELERQLLLAEMVTLNFHDHFEFKPLLLEMDDKLRSEGEKGDDGRHEIASVARRVIDRQINMLTSIDGVSGNGRAGYGAKITRIDLLNSIDTSRSKDQSKKQLQPNFLPPPPQHCLTESDIEKRNKAKQINKLPTIPVLICLSSPDKKTCVLLRLTWNSKPLEKNTNKRTPKSEPFQLKNEPIAMKSWVYANRSSGSDCDPRNRDEIDNLDDVQQLDETSLSIFDFPLTDNTQIFVPLTSKRLVFHRGMLMWMDDKYAGVYRYAVSLYRFNGIGDTSTLTLKVVWFPQGYVTERERPPPKLVG
jgi:hypothetical protein